MNQKRAAIFDVDGLLVDSEPLWNKATSDILNEYNVVLSADQLATATGFRTKELVTLWFNSYSIPPVYVDEATAKILERTKQYMSQHLVTMNGVSYIFQFFKEKNYLIGLASSSPMGLIEVAIRCCGISDKINTCQSAHDLEFAKPHPEVYINAAKALSVHPAHCICFEDSFSGMIAAKAAGMKCVVVPHHRVAKKEHWAAADLKISSLKNFGQLHLNFLER